MTDLVMLAAVRWLLRERRFPFRAYEVEYGNGNEQKHDIMARVGRRALAGEVFNVAESYFNTKKGKVLKKLRASRPTPDFRLLVCNHDAVERDYEPQPRSGEHFLFVDIGTGRIRMNSV